MASFKTITVSKIISNKLIQLLIAKICHTDSKLFTGVNENMRVKDSLSHLNAVKFCRRGVIKITFLYAQSGRCISLVACLYPKVWVTSQGPAICPVQASALFCHSMVEYLKIKFTQQSSVLIKVHWRLACPLPMTVDPTKQPTEHSDFLLFKQMFDVSLVTF